MLEWIELSAQATIVASESGASLHLPQAFGADPFREPMRGPGSPETTRWLLEGSIALAGRAVRAARRTGGERSVDHHWLGHSQWAYRLAGYFHTTFATRRILPQVAQRFARAGNPRLGAWAEQKLREEAGHDELALRDLSELGYDAPGLVSALCPPRAAAWVELFEHLAESANPAGCVGYAHALERLALLRGPAEIAAIEQRLPQGSNATRCLRVHSALGSDKTHIHVNLEAAAASSADDRRAIASACHRTALVYFDPTYDNVGSPLLDEQLNAYRVHAQRPPGKLSRPITINRSLSMDEWRAIVKRAWDDDDFKTRLKTETAAVLQEYGIKVPQGVKFTIVEDQLVGERHLVLPPRPKADDPSLSIDDFGRDAEDGDPGF